MFKDKFQMFDLGLSTRRLDIIPALQIFLSEQSHNFLAQKMHFHNNML